MTIKKCNCTIKCDANGCGNLAEKEISFKRIEADLRLCPSCFKELCGELAAYEKTNGRTKK